MKFSIIVPIYNVRNYLEECIQSVLNQDYPGWELILVDDGSTDGSEIICDKFAESYNQIKVIHQSNTGVSAARNKGIRVAAGEYLFFLDGDDFMFNNVLSRINQLLKVNDYDIILASMSFYKSKNKTFNNPIKDEKIYTGDNLTEEIIRRVQEGHMVTNSVTNVYKKDFLLRNEIYFDTGYISGEDLDFCSKFFMEKLSYLSCNIPLCAYRINREGSATTDITAKALESQLNVYIKWFNYFQNTEIPPDKKYLICSTYAIAFVTKISAFPRVEREFRSGLMNIAKKNFHIINYPKRKKYRLIYYCYKVFGISLGIKVLKVYHSLFSKWVKIK